MIVAAALGAAAFAVRRDLARARDDAKRGRALQLMSLFASPMEEARKDPTALLVWQPLARTARAMLPDEFVILDKTFGATFPFSAETIQAAHAQWSADWLAWESAHDAEYKHRAAEVQHDRLKLDAVEREKLARYQRKYAEYVRTAKALQALNT